MKLCVNEAWYTVDVAPEEKLVRVLRDRLHLAGTKEGCSQGHCGSCTVLVAGKTVQSCRVPVGDVGDKPIITIEGLGRGDSLHPVQRAFLAAGAVQCGFCTPGLVLAVKALLDVNPQPGPGEITRLLNGHLCRCTGYIKLAQAVELARAYLPEGWRPWAPPRSDHPVGARIVRFDGVDKVTGKAMYAADRWRDDMLHARFVRSPHFHARITGIDCREARSAPGVAAVLTAADIPGINGIGFAKDEPVLAKDKVRYLGEPVALVVAESDQIANQAAARVRVYYEPLPVIQSPVEAILPSAIKIHDSGNVLWTQKLQKGDAASALSQCGTVVEGEFRTPWNDHAYLEPEAGLAYLDETGQLVLETSTQHLHSFQEEIALVLGFPRDRVKIVPTSIGGGFGGKAFISFQAALAVAAWYTRKPVKLVYTREESLLASTKRHPYVIKARLGADAAGNFQALEMEILADTGAYSSAGRGVITKAAVHAAGPYGIGNMEVTASAVHTNNPVASAMRGYGVPQVAFALESLVEELARQLGRDPLQTRAQNALVQGSATATGHVLNWDPGYTKTLEAVQRFRAENPLPERKLPENVRRGTGFGCVWYGLGRIGGSSRAEADVELLPGGIFGIRTGAMDMGQGIHTALIQIVAETLNQPLGNIQLIAGDSQTLPDAGFTSASRQTYVSGNAVVLASQELRERMLERAGQIFNVPPQEVELDRGFCRHLEKGRVSFDQLLSSSNEPLTGHGDFDVTVSPIHPLTGQGIPVEVYASGTQMADVEVNLVTGDVRVIRVVAAHNVGRAINPLLVEGQIEGSVVMGLGLALKEEYLPGITSSFADYRIPRARDIPEIITIIVEVPAPRGPFGAIGVGEHALVPTAGAIANAIAAACRKRPCSLPIKPGWIKSAAADSR